MTLIVMGLVFGRMPDKAPFCLRPFLRAMLKKLEHGYFAFDIRLIAVILGPQLKLYTEFIEAELGKSEWFAGEELTGAGLSFPYVNRLIRRYHDEFPSVHFGHKRICRKLGSAQNESIFGKDGGKTSI